MPVWASRARNRDRPEISGPVEEVHLADDGIVIGRSSEGAGFTVAVRVTGAPTAAEPVGLVVSVVPDTVTCWRTAGAVGSVGLQAKELPSLWKLRDEIATGTTEPGVPEMGTVEDSPVQFNEVMPLAFVGVNNGGVIVTPSGESPMVGFLTES